MCLMDRTFAPPKKIGVRGGGDHRHEHQFFLAEKNNEL